MFIKQNTDSIFNNKLSIAIFKKRLSLKWKHKQITTRRGDLWLVDLLIFDKYEKVQWLIQCIKKKTVIHCLR